MLRSKGIDDVPLLKAANSKNLAEKVAVAVANLKHRGASKPRTVKTLSSTVSSVFQKQLPEEELAGLVGELQRLGFVIVHDNKVSYALPDTET